MLEKSLQQLGFSPSEKKVYIHLISYGASYANKISAETRLNRTNVYEALERLKAKGVVAFITQNKVKWFEAKPPQALVGLLHGREEELRKTEQILLEEIRHIPPDHKQLLQAEIFTGKKGLRMLFEEMLEVAKPISLIASQLQFLELFGPYFELWHRKRAEKKIRQQSIFPHRFEKQLKKRPYLEYKFVDNRFTSPTTTILYGEVCLLIEWSDEPLAIKIHNKGITKSQLNYFRMMWDS